MIFALDRDSGELAVLPSPIEALTHCKAVDVQDGFWLFFDEDGSPLEARFDDSEDPNDLPGPYSLERPMSGLWLQERLDRVVTVKGCGLTNVEDLVETLKINRGKRAAGNWSRG